MEEDDLWNLAFGDQSAPRAVRFDVDDPFEGGGGRDDEASYSDEPDVRVRDEFVTDYETEVNVRGAKGGTFKDQSKMTPEERARVNLMSVLSDYEFANSGGVADQIVKWFSRAPRRDLSRMHMPTLVCAWLWYQKHKTDLKGLPSWCQKHHIDELSAATYVAILGGVS